MRDILRHRGLRFVFTANVISMLGSGMNSAAVTWYILQATHSELSLGWLMVLQTLPAMLLLPFTGVLIDRGDRRRLVMVLDALRGIIILTVAILAFVHRVHIWQLYLMNVLVALGFWVFWPTITALIQELTPESEFVHSNSFLMAGIQGGWLMAGALVGFVYNHIGLGGVLLIDFSTYLVSLSCYLFVRKGRHIVMPAAQEQSEPSAASGVTRYIREMREGFDFLRCDRSLTLLGVAWAFFIGAMLIGGVVTAPLSDRILHAGAVGYGWLNAGWAVGASLSAFYAPRLIGRLSARRALVISFAVLTAAFFLSPFSPLLVLAVSLYAAGGSARGVSGIALSTNLMRAVPKHFMGRVQNCIYFAGTGLQLVFGLLVGLIAHRIGLTYAFAIIAGMYLLACLSSFASGETRKINADELALNEAAGD
ncbi:MAG TPA: MFS transporter [Terriglobales bacterium]|nr:MFS transporter [Terriglobales bacterium]